MIYVVRSYIQGTKRSEYSRLGAILTGLTGNPDLMDTDSPTQLARRPIPASKDLRQADSAEIRALAREIVTHSPGLTQLLLAVARKPNFSGSN